jgi:hypothetical protein
MIDEKKAGISLVYFWFFVAGAPEGAPSLLAFASAFF